MDILSKNIIGKGPSFPFNRSDSGGINYTDYIDRINQSLFILFETPKCSRLNMPEFGSDLRLYRFDPLDNILIEKMRITITQDIARWEPRIALKSIEFLSNSYDIDNSTLYININYQIVNTSITANYVYPYRLETYDTIDINYN